MSGEKTTKCVDIQSCTIGRRAEDSHMVMKLSTKVGAFEFAFSPERWQQLSASAEWFWANGAAISEEQVKSLQQAEKKES